MLKLALLALLFPLSLSTYAQSLDWVCFKSINQKNETRLAFAFSNASDSSAFVYYERGSRPIPLKTIRHESENWVPGRPDNNYYTFIEMIGGKAGGTYTMSYQGAIFDEFTYTSPARRKFSFEQTSSRECTWVK